MDSLKLNDRERDVISSMFNNLTLVDTRVCTDKNGNLDIAKFNEIDFVKGTVSQLKQMGITKDWLFSKGYIVAGMLLRF